MAAFLQCGKHVSEHRGFCALERGHKDACNVFPRIERQGVGIPETRKLVHAVAAHFVRIPRIKDAIVTCLGWTVGGSDGCGALLPVKNLTYIQTHWYTEPYSCNGGDYWNEGEGQFACPECGAINRLYERPEVVKLKSYFKDVKNVHSRN